MSHYWVFQPFEATEWFENFRSQLHCYKPEEWTCWLHYCEKLKTSTVLVVKKGGFWKAVNAVLHDWKM